MVAAGTVLNSVIAASMFLQEVSIQLGKPVPFYLDSESTHAISHDEMAPKKSIWTRRRSAVVLEGVESGVIKALLIEGEKMVADPMSKYVPYAKWIQMMRYIEDVAEKILPRIKPVSKSDFLAAVARRKENRPWDNDFVILSHAISRGVNGMSKAEAAKAME